MTRAGAGKVRLQDILPPALQLLLVDGEGLLRSGAEARKALEKLGPACAMDPRLRRRTWDYGVFLTELLNKGIIELSDDILEEAGVFMVGRKDGMLRLIFDTRRPNCHFTPPPATELASGEALSDLELEAGAAVALRSGDVEVCFY